MRGTRLFEHEEIILRNTFVNAQMGPLADFRSHLGREDHQRVPKLKWIDNCEDNKQKLRTNNSEDDLVCKIDDDAVQPMDFHRRKDKIPHKSTIKPFKQSIGEVTGVLDPPPADTPSAKHMKAERNISSAKKQEQEPKIPTPDMFYQDSSKLAPSKKY